MTAASWMQEYDLAASLGADIQSDMNEKDRLAKSGANSARVQAGIRKKVDQLQSDVARLTKSLGDMERRPMDFKIGEGELNRRRGLLSQLRRTLEGHLKAATGEGASNAAKRYVGAGVFLPPAFTYRV